jgi:hypothetical protein
VGGGDGLELVGLQGIREPFRSFGRSMATPRSPGVYYSGRRSGGTIGVQRAGGLGVCGEMNQ